MTVRVEGTPQEQAELREAIAHAYPGLVGHEDSAGQCVRELFDEFLQRWAYVAAEQESKRVLSERQSSRARVEDMGGGRLLYRGVREK